MERKKKIASKPVLKSIRISLIICLKRINLKKRFQEGFQVAISDLYVTPRATKKTHCRHDIQTVHPGICCDRLFDQHTILFGVYYIPGIKKHGVSDIFIHLVSFPKVSTDADNGVTTVLTTVSSTRVRARVCI